MKKIFLLLLLAAPASAQISAPVQSGGTNVANPDSGNLTPSSVTISNLGTGRVVYTQTGGILASSSTFVVSSNGKVGIGTANPCSTCTLHVNGDTSLNGTLQIGTTLYVTNSNVGIGTSNPQNKLHLSSGTVYIDGNVANGLTVGDGLSAYNMVINGSNGGGAQYILKNAGTTQANFQISGGNTYLDSTGTLNFRTGGGSGATNMVILTGGNVGIGASNPTSLLHVSSGTIFRDGSVNVNAYAVNISSVNGSTSTFSVMGSGHVDMGGNTVPVLSSCGTGPVLVPGSNDARGAFTVGSGNTSCTLTFAVPYVQGFCFIVDATGGLTSPGWTIKVTSSISLSSLTASDNYGYFCWGQ